MDLLSWVDNRTLLMSSSALIAVFTVSLLGLRSFYPHISGVKSVIWGFVCGPAALWLLVSEGRVPWIASVVCGSGFLFLSYILLYTGVLSFCRSEGVRSKPGKPTDPSRHPGPLTSFLPVLYAAASAALIALFVLTRFGLHPTACVVIIMLMLGLARMLLAWTLYQASAGRRHMLAFAASMALFGLLSLVHAAVVLRISSPSDVMHHDRTETLNLLLSMAFFCVQGIFYLLMFAGHVAETMEDQAHLDYVCATLNRRGIEEALEAEIARTRRSGGCFAALILDLDNFKSINDRFGHAGGDEALRKVTRAINASVRVYDLLGRFGGDEFLVLLPQTGSDNAQVTANRIRQAVAADATMPGGTGFTLSIGITTGTSPETTEEILARADAALYEAKAAGRNCVRLKLSATRGVAHRPATPVLSHAGDAQELSGAVALTGNA
jgi:diguanylate cyclase (GGDEF)-like protein